MSGSGVGCVVRENSVKQQNKRLSGNAVKPCENTTGRNPYNEDLAPDHADTLRMGRARMNA